MKVGEQAIFFARLKGLGKAEAEKALRQWFERLEISQWWDKKIEELSKGMAQKVQFIVTVLHEPELLIFDEPFSGFDPINAGILKDEILRLRDKGTTIIFSTHNMESVEELCDEITLINRSHNILSGNVAEVRERFAHNLYSLSFVGNPQSLQAAVSPFTDSFELGAVDSYGLSKATVRLKDAEAARPFIAAANDAVALSAFSRVIPSMNDIFVSAVKASNEAAGTDPVPQA